MELKDQISKVVFDWMKGFLDQLYKDSKRDRRYYILVYSIERKSIELAERILESRRALEFFSAPNPTKRTKKQDFLSSQLSEFSKKVKQEFR